MIDSHAHLIWDCFEQEIDDVISRAREAGVNGIVHPCVELVDLPKMQSLVERFPEYIYIAAGVHPCHANTWNGDESVRIVHEWKDRIVAIGETGLDYYHKDVDIPTQEISFRAQCRLARELDLPIIIHCRDAFQHTYDVLVDEGVMKGVMHCYTGDYAWAERFLELGFYISWSGCLTYKRSTELRDAATRIPLERTLTETDAPFLAPQSNRGKTNEPSYMKEVTELIAELRGEPFETIDRITEENARELFGL